MKYEFVNETYDGRVCQYNFAVTTPYMMQKGSSLSSFEDDLTVLGDFHFLDGRPILGRDELRTITFLQKTSTTNAFDTIQTQTYKEISTVVNPIEKTHPFARFVQDVNDIRKAPAKELYVIDADATIEYTLSSDLNSGKPTTLIVA